MKENTEYCFKCNKKVEYIIRENIIEEYKGIKVNVKENIGVCSECGEDIFIIDVENDNLKRLYAKYEQVTGVTVKSRLKIIK